MFKLKDYYEYNGDVDAERTCEPPLFIVGQLKSPHMMGKNIFYIRSTDNYPSNFDSNNDFLLNNGQLSSTLPQSSSQNWNQEPQIANCQEAQAQEDRMQNVELPYLSSEERGDISNLCSIAPQLDRPYYCDIETPRQNELRSPRKKKKQDDWKEIPKDELESYRTQCELVCYGVKGLRKISKEKFIKIHNYIRKNKIWKDHNIELKVLKDNAYHKSFLEYFGQHFYCKNIMLACLKIERSHILNHILNDDESPS